MLLLLLLGCSYVPESGPADIGIGGPDVVLTQRCPEGFFDGNIATAAVRNFEVDRVPAVAVIEKLCIKENGLTMRAELLVEGELPIVEMESYRSAGYLFLPSPTVLLTISHAGETWHETDTLEGLVILMPIDERSDRFEGDIDFWAENNAGLELYFGMTWTGRP